MTLLLPDMHDPLPVSQPDNLESLIQCENEISWNNFFGNAHPVEIEVGCGKGKFIIRSALEHPETNYLGIERSGKFFRIMQQRAFNSGVQNIKLLNTDADYFIRNYIPEGSVQAYHIYFPDPWPKQRHHKRRLINAGFMEAIKSSLASSGCIFFATDFTDYFTVMVTVARACSGLEEVFNTSILPAGANPEDAATSYERKYLLQGRVIYKAAYRKIIHES